jgi:hypothetical protein
MAAFKSEKISVTQKLTIHQFRGTESLSTTINRLIDFANEIPSCRINTFLNVAASGPRARSAASI